MGGGVGVRDGIEAGGLTYLPTSIRSLSQQSAYLSLELLPTGAVAVTVTVIP